MIIRSIAICSLLIIYVTGQVIKDYVDNVTNSVNVHEKSEILSRRKRFLVFPEGSSVQLVFCNTFPSINVIGDIILFGYTAALAYELPQDPYSPFDHHADPLHRRVDTKEIYYLDEDGRILHKRPYQRKFIVNPAFAKRSVVSHDTESGKDRANQKEETDFKTARKQMHRAATRRFLIGASNMDRRSVEFHRTSRVLLYRKIETMLQGLGGKGRECMLNTLCLVGQTQEAPQGSFFQEILRAVFTLPKGPNDDEDTREYDNAHWATESCEKLYPDCSEPVNGPELATVM